MSEIGAKSITANGTYEIATLIRPVGLGSWTVTVQGFGTWDGGTMSFGISLNGGDNIQPIDDSATASPTNFERTDDFLININEPPSSHGRTTTKLYVILSGASSPSLTVLATSNE